MRTLTPNTTNQPEEPQPPEAVTELELAARVFMGFGFGAKSALLLAMAHVSPATARELLRHGCSKETALRILL